VIPSIPKLNVRALFAIAVIFKVTFAIFGWILNDPIIWGTLVPLLVMTGYILLGYKSRTDDISEEKFADSCYYIGFIFTIVTIIVCLVDIPKMAPGKGMTEVAWRFGAAMTSTVFGMVVRVWLVGFRQDLGDGVRDAESRLVRAASEFVNQLELVRQRLQSLDVTVVDAASATVATVNARVEASGQAQAEALREYHAVMLAQTQMATQGVVNELRTTSGAVKSVIEELTKGLRSTVTSFDSELLKATKSLQQRLTTEALPKEIFAAQLKPAIEQLNVQAGRLGQSVQRIAEEVENSATVLGKSVRGLDNKVKRATDVQRVLESFEHIVNSHGAIIGAIQSQQAAIEQLASLLAAAEQRLAAVGQDVRSGLTLSPASSKALAKVLTPSIDASNAALASELAALRVAIAAPVLGLPSQQPLWTSNPTQSGASVSGPSLEITLTGDAPSAKSAGSAGAGASPTIPSVWRVVQSRPEEGRPTPALEPVAVPGPTPPRIE
jgi:hypothetical protein